MSTARERVEQEADARWPLTPNVWEDQHNRDRRGGFIAGRTVTAEQLEEVAIYLANVDGLELPCVPDEDEAWGRYRYLARETLRAAGFIVEEK